MVASFSLPCAYYRFYIYNIFWFLCCSHIFSLSLLDLLGYISDRVQVLYCFNFVEFECVLLELPCVTTMCSPCLVAFRNLIDVFFSLLLPFSFDFITFSDSFCLHLSWFCSILFFLDLITFSAFFCLNSSWFCSNLFFLDLFLFPPPSVYIYLVYVSFFSSLIKFFTASFCLHLSCFCCILFSLDIFRVSAPFLPVLHHIIIFIFLFFLFFLSWAVNLLVSILFPHSDELIWRPSWLHTFGHIGHWYPSGSAAHLYILVPS